MVNGIFSEIVELGRQTPLNRKQGGFSTVSDNPSDVRIEIYRTSKQGTSGLESCKDKEMRFLGDFMLRGVPPAPSGVPQITVTMDIDADAILRVRADLEGTGKSADSKSIHLSVDRELERLEEEEQE